MGEGMAMATGGLRRLSASGSWSARGLAPIGLVTVGFPGGAIWHSGLSPYSGGWRSRRCTQRYGVASPQRLVHGPPSATQAWGRPPVRTDSDPPLFARAVPILCPSRDDAEGPGGRHPRCSQPRPCSVRSAASASLRSPARGLQAQRLTLPPGPRWPRRPVTGRSSTAEPACPCLFDDIFASKAWFRHVIYH